MEVLFNKYDMYRLGNATKETLKKEIMNEKKDYILRVDEDQYLDSLTGKFTIEKIRLLEANIIAKNDSRMIRLLDFPDYSRFLYGEDPYCKVEKQIITYKIPFEGDRDMLHVRPTTWLSVLPRGKVGNNSIELEYILGDVSQEEILKVKQKYERDLDILKKYIEYLGKDVDKINSELYDTAKSTFKKRKDDFLKTDDLLSLLNVPIAKSTNNETYSVSPIKKKKSVYINKPVVNTKEPLEPSISIEIYNDITNTINNVGKQFERCPSVYAGKEEEHLRDHILMMLSSNFELGEATGETFNKNGKTDIMVKYKGNNVFVGECKFWKGEKGFIDTISQILNYLTWRDSKAAVIMFVRNDNFSEIINKATEAIKKHNNYVDFLEEKDESWFNYKFNINGDTGKRLYLSLMLYHIPKNYKK